MPYTAYKIKMLTEHQLHAAHNSIESIRSPAISA